MDSRETSNTALFFLTELHTLALLFLVTAYAIKIAELMQKFSVETITPRTSKTLRAVCYAFALLVIPWRMDSYRRDPLRYAEFAVLHLAIATAIGTFATLQWTRAFCTREIVAIGLRGVFLSGAIVGLVRLCRRIARREMRLISTPDDYFSLLLVTAWLVSGWLAVPFAKELYLIVFLTIGTVCLFYEPFSKLFHYLYWPFLRYYMGQYFGHRGVYPVRPDSADQSVQNYKRYL
ncbi:MAG: hypothetical protein JXA30_11980 [Deltaproteobacteria bacterium]|nr:hypothetical protein [Deltaproteobacteria bacterium]